MKYSYVILIFLILNIGCKKENLTDSEPIYLTSVKAGQSAGAGIHYVDFEPDKKLVTQNGSDYFLTLDLNNDSIDDFELKYVSMTYGRWYKQYSQIIPLGNNSVCVLKNIISPGNDYIEPLKDGDLIGNDNNWINSKAYLYTFYKNWQYYHNPDTTIVTNSLDGYFCNQSDVFVGVRILKDDRRLFGWIDMKDNEVRRYAISSPY